MELDELRGVFHLARDEAAAALGMTPTALKRVCRKVNIERWPYRKLQSLQNLLDSSQQKPMGDASAQEKRVLAILAEQEHVMKNPNHVIDKALLHMRLLTYKWRHADRTRALTTMARGRGSKRKASPPDDSELGSSDDCMAPAASTPPPASQLLASMSSSRGPTSTGPALPDPNPVTPDAGWDPKGVPSHSRRQQQQQQQQYRQPPVGRVGECQLPGRLHRGGGAGGQPGGPPATLPAGAWLDPLQNGSQQPQQPSQQQAWQQQQQQQGQQQQKQQGQQGQQQQKQQQQQQKQQQQPLNRQQEQEQAQGQAQQLGAGLEEHQAQARALLSSLPLQQQLQCLLAWQHIGAAGKAEQHSPEPLTLAQASKQAQQALTPPPRQQAVQAAGQQQQQQGLTSSTACTPLLTSPPVLLLDLQPPTAQVRSASQLRQGGDKQAAADAVSQSTWPGGPPGPPPAQLGSLEVAPPLTVQTKARPSPPLPPSPQPKVQLTATAATAGLTLDPDPDPAPAPAPSPPSANPPCPLIPQQCQTQLLPPTLAPTSVAASPPTASTLNEGGCPPTSLRHQPCSAPPAILADTGNLECDSEQPGHKSTQTPGLTPASHTRLPQPHTHSTTHTVSHSLTQSRAGGGYLEGSCLSASSGLGIHAAINHTGGGLGLAMQAPCKPDSDPAMCRNGREQQPAALPFQLHPGLFSLTMPQSGLPPLQLLPSMLLRQAGGEAQGFGGPMGQEGLSWPPLQLQGAGGLLAGLASAAQAPASLGEALQGLLLGLQGQGQPSFTPHTQGQGQGQGQGESTGLKRCSSHEDTEVLPPQSRITWPGAGKLSSQQARAVVADGESRCPPPSAPVGDTQPLTRPVANCGPGPAAIGPSAAAPQEPSSPPPARLAAPQLASGPPLALSTTLQALQVLQVMDSFREVLEGLHMLQGLQGLQGQRQQQQGLQGLGGVVGLQGLLALGGLPIPPVGAHSFPGASSSDWLGNRATDLLLAQAPPFPCPPQASHYPPGLLPAGLPQLLSARAACSAQSACLGLPPAQPQQPLHRSPPHSQPAQRWPGAGQGSCLQDHEPGWLQLQGAAKGQMQHDMGLGLGLELGQGQRQGLGLGQGGCGLSRPRSGELPLAPAVIKPRANTTHVVLASTPHPATPSQCAWSRPCPDPPASAPAAPGGGDNAWRGLQALMQAAEQAAGHPE